ncbi:hypothetical protein BB65665_12986, partial [Bacillus sp. 916]|uniref:hypothetical protein n=1 Tax=Bacillus sp. 916 TaxID=1007654 RepID=UPI00026B9FA3
NNGFSVLVETRFSGNLYKIEKVALDGLNDCYGFTFSDLARLIEISLEGGFGKMIDAPVSPFSKGN